MELVDIQALKYKLGKLDLSTPGLNVMSQFIIYLKRLLYDNY